MTGEEKWVLPVSYNEGAVPLFSGPYWRGSGSPLIPHLFVKLWTCSQGLVSFTICGWNLSFAVPKISVRMCRSLDCVTLFLSVEIKNFLFVFVLFFRRKSVRFFSNCKISYAETRIIYFIQSLSTKLQSRWKTLIFSTRPMYNNANKKIWTVITQCSNIGTRKLWFWEKK